MDTRILVKPFRVSPLIKLARWSLLIYGIYYGNMKWHYYHKVQVHIREERHKIWPMIKEQMRLENMEMNTMFYKDTAKQFGIELPPDWDASTF